MCIEVIAKISLNKSQAELFEKPEPPVWWIELLGPSGEVSHYSDEELEGRYV
jgi:hypothetical protein